MIADGLSKILLDKHLKRHLWLLDNIWIVTRGLALLFFHIYYQFQD
jgi:hypothetical protein